MSKLYCFYDLSKKAIATRKCDMCGKLLCSACGYVVDGVDYCNECYNSEECKSKNEQDD